jgi:predicted house-cleaning noncanonical NTP pyrophosphatase (MazG superfamily)
MANEIVFKIGTEAFYSAEEKNALLEAFIEFMVDYDEDSDADTAEVVISDSSAEPSSNGEISDEKKREIISEFLNNAQIEYQVHARFRDEDGKPVGQPLDATGYLD